MKSLQPRLTDSAIANALIHDAADSGWTPDPTPTPLDGAALYGTYCGSCHGSLATSSKRGTTAAATQSAISNNRGGMGSLSSLTTEQIQAIVAALGTTPAPTPDPTPTPTPNPDPTQ
jgi:mono/diheme cytochrome c family protein